MSDPDNKYPETEAQHEGDEVDVGYGHSKRRLMEIAIAVTSALAIICGISITVASHYHKNSLLIWFTYFTVIFALLVPALYWQKHEWARAEIPSLVPQNPISASPTPSISPSPSPSPSPSVTPTKPLRVVGGGPSLQNPKHPTRNSGPPYYADLDALKWTDYTEDYFGGAIWRWGYRPEMGDKEPRNICGFCPDCSYGLRTTPIIVTDANGQHYTVFECPLGCNKFNIPAFNADEYNGVRRLIREKLKDRSYWEEVVMRQREARWARRI
jgi:hypothetical protein